MGSAGMNGYHDTAKAKGPGVTVGRSGASFGQVNYCPVDYWPHNTALYVTNFHGNDTRFTYYFLKSIDFSRYNSGSAQASLNRNFIYPIPVRVPKPNEQRAIASVLGALDDKIKLNRRMTAEAGEIALSVDGGQWHRETSRFHRISLAWELEDDPVFGMRDSELGNRFMEEQLKKVMASVEAEGELTEAAIASVVFRGKPYRLTRELENLRRTSQPDAAEVSPEAWREKEKARILTFLRQELTYLSWRRSSCAERERKEEAARQSAAVLPSLETLEKIQRYETRLERQLYRAMAQLERLQRIRRGEAVPAPLSVEVSSRNE